VGTSKELQESISVARKREGDLLAKENAGQSEGAFESPAFRCVCYVS